MSKREISGDEVEAASDSGSEKAAARAKKKAKTEIAENGDETKPAKEKKEKKERKPRVIDADKTYARAKEAKQEAMDAMFEAFDMTHAFIHAKNPPTKEAAYSAVSRLEKAIVADRRAGKKRDAARAKRDEAKKEKGGKEKAAE